MDHPHPLHCFKVSQTNRREGIHSTLVTKLPLLGLQILLMSDMNLLIQVDLHIKEEGVCWYVCFFFSFKHSYKQTSVCNELLFRAFK